MSQTTPSLRFLGLDLRALWLEFRSPWQGMHQWSALTWLTPDLPVRVWHVDGRETTWLGSRIVHGVKAKAVRFEAIELPEAILLRRTLTMPAMPQEEIAQAVALDVRDASPFVLADLVWGYSTQPVAQGGLLIDIVFASRKQATQYIDTQKHRLAAAIEPEVWAFTPAGAPIVLAGWGEARRTRHGAMHRRQAYALLLGALCLLVGIAVTPTAQLRLRAVDATHAYEAVQRRTAALVGQREAFVRSTDQLQSLHGMLVDRADPLRLLEILTQTLPDDTFLHTLQVQGLKVTIKGLTTNAATLMQLLGAQNGIKEVRAPSAAIRNPGATAENFIIDFQLDPAVLSLGAAVPVAAASAALAAQSVTAPKTEGAAPVDGAAVPNSTSATSTPVPPATGASAPHKSRFSSGPEGPAATPTPKVPPAAATQAAASKTAP